MSFVNETIKPLIGKNKITDHFKIMEEPENGNLDQPIDEVQTLINHELNETRNGSPTTPQLVHENEIWIAIIATLKKKQQKMWTGGSHSLEAGRTRENFNECLGELISNKLVKHNTVNRRECLSLPEDEINDYVVTMTITLLVISVF